MDLVVSSFFIFAVAAFGFILTANLWRSNQDPPYELVPNCLLTRAPLLFVTGPRSVLYFKKYWNIYPSYLAEHGYEVYTLRLPWRSGELRAKALARAFRAAREENQSYHLIVDHWGLQDLKSFDANALAPVRSVNFIGSGPLENPELPGMAFIEMDKKAKILRALYRLHLTVVQKPTPSLAALGGTCGVQMQNARLLLERARILAEKDHLELS